jgi:hypothetical protein
MNTEYNDPWEILSKEEAAEKNNAVPMDEKIRRSVHELTHHLIAEHYGLPCEGIELGHMEGHPRIASGLAHTGDYLAQKNAAGEPITLDENRAYVHAVLSNGYGDEAIFGTDAGLRGDEIDVRRARWHLEGTLGYTKEEADAFIADSIEQTRKILADPKIKENLLNAGKKVARENWGTGLMSRDAVNDVLNIKKGM